MALRYSIADGSAGEIRPGATRMPLSRVVGLSRAGRVRFFFGREGFAERLLEAVQNAAAGGGDRGFFGLGQVIGGVRRAVAPTERGRAWLITDCVRGAPLRRAGGGIAAELEPELSETDC